MILYVIELEMDAALREDYMTWLVGHVHEMLALPGFIDAEPMARIEPPPPDGRWVAYATAVRGRPTFASMPRACAKPGSPDSVTA